MNAAQARPLAPGPGHRTVLLTFATVSWQKGSAAQVASLVGELRKLRSDLRFLLLSHCPELDRGPAQDLGIDVVDPGFSPDASRNRRSIGMLGKRLTFTARSLLHRTGAPCRATSREPTAQAYAGADFVLDLSGDSYRDPPGGFAVAHHANLMAALAARVPYALVSQSLGPFHPVNRPLARYLLRRAALVYVRENRTREILMQLGVERERMLQVPDVAFALPAASARPIWTGEDLDAARIPRPWVAVSMSDLALRLSEGTPRNRYVDEFARLAQHLRSSYRASVFLVPHEVNPPYYGTDDRSAADVLAEGLGRPAWMHSIRGDYGPSVLKGFIGECDAVVASRMHAAIAGLSSGVPTLLVSWSHKYQGLMEDIGLENCVWDQFAAGAGRLDELFDRLWERRNRVRERLRDYTARAGRQIAGMCARIAACIPGGSDLQSGSPASPRAEAG